MFVDPNSWALPKEIVRKMDPLTEMTVDLISTLLFNVLLRDCFFLHNIFHEFLFRIKNEPPHTYTRGSFRSRQRQVHFHI